MSGLPRHPQRAPRSPRARRRCRHLLSINIKINETWSPDSPPSDWTQLVARWKAIDTYRASAAMLAFALFLVAFALD